MFERLYGLLGPERDDILAALIQMTGRNSMVQKKSDAKPITDFLPKWSPPQELDEGSAIANGQDP